MAADVSKRSFGPIATSPEHPIRIATRHDIPAVWEIVRTCRDALINAGSDQWDTVYPTERDIVRDVLAHDAYLLETNGTAVGTVTLNRDADPTYDALKWQTSPPALIVHRLCVVPAASGQRHGHALMEFAELHAKASGYRSIRLDAYPKNLPAIALYRSRGYREVGSIVLPRRSAAFVCFEKAIDAEPG